MRIKVLDLAIFEGKVWLLIDSCWQLMKKNCIWVELVNQWMMEAQIFKSDGYYQGNRVRLSSFCLRPSGTETNKPTCSSLPPWVPEWVRQICYNSDRYISLTSFLKFSGDAFWVPKHFCILKTDQVTNFWLSCAVNSYYSHLDLQNLM